MNKSILAIALSILVSNVCFAQDAGSRAWKKGDVISVKTKRHLISKNTMVKAENFDRKSTETLKMTIQEVKDGNVTQLKYERNEINDKDKSVIAKISLIAALEEGNWEIYEYQIEPVKLMEEVDEDKADFEIRTSAIEKDRIKRYAEVNFKLHTGFVEKMPVKVGSESKYKPTFGPKIPDAMKNIEKQESSAKLVKSGEALVFDISFKERSKSFVGNKSREFKGQLTIDRKTGLCKNIKSTEKAKTSMFGGKQSNSQVLTEVSSFSYTLG